MRGVCLGGWLNMENFITGYAANESLMRSTVAATIGADRSAVFFDRLLQSFFGEADAQWLGGCGFNVVRIPVNYRHFESDDRPLEIMDSGFAHLDRAIAALSTHGMYSIIDLHTVPGSQNHHWHSDNPTHVPAFWQHRQFQDRAINLWQAIATRYRDEPAVAGYNLLNEPADETRAVVGPFYERLGAAIREIDPVHIHFLDGNTYATEFGFFGEPAANTVYTLHDYVPAGLGRGHGYPGTVDGIYYDLDGVLKTFLERSEYARASGTPLMVGEFGPIYTGRAGEDEQRLQLLADQLSIYDDYDVSWTLWTYKDVGRQGLVSARPDSPYLKRFASFIGKKDRLAADKWGSDGEGPVEVDRPGAGSGRRGVPELRPLPVGPHGLGPHPVAQHPVRTTAGLRVRRSAQRAWTTANSPR